MGLRAYLLLETVDNLGKSDLEKAVKELENTPGVDFIDLVVGSKDMVVMVDSAISVESIANAIRRFGWVKDIEILRIANPLGQSHFPGDACGCEHCR